MKTEEIKVFATVIQHGKTIGLCIVDVLIIDSIPFAVPMWTQNHDHSERATDLVQLEPRYLHKAPGVHPNATHLYELPIDLSPRQ